MFRSFVTLASFMALLGQAKRCDSFHRDHRGSSPHSQQGRSSYGTSATIQSASAANGFVADAGPTTAVTASAAATQGSKEDSEAEISASGNAGAQASSSRSFKTSGDMDGYSNRIFLDFTSVQSGDDAESFLSKAGFAISTSEIPAGDAPLARKHYKENVKLGDGLLEMTTQAYSGSGPVSSAEIHTKDEFLYGSARVVLKSTPVPGICIGHFYYANDNQETDIELLTSTALKTTDSGVPEGVWFTNQALSKDVDATDKSVDYGFDPSEDFHEYRIDWLEDYTAFFIDGEEKSRFTTNVPNVASAYMLNGWSNGDDGWSAGPPTKDATFTVKSIEVLHK